VLVRGNDKFSASALCRAKMLGECRPASCHCSVSSVFQCLLVFQWSWRSLRLEQARGKITPPLSLGNDTVWF